MLEGLVKKIAIDFEVESIAKSAKASKEAKIVEVGADIDLVIRQPYKGDLWVRPRLGLFCIWILYSILFTWKTQTKFSSRALYFLGLIKPEIPYPIRTQNQNAWNYTSQAMDIGRW